MDWRELTEFVGFRAFGILAPLKDELDVLCVPTEALPSL